MRAVIQSSLVLLLALTVQAQVKRSSRNLEPLTKRPGAVAGTRSGNTGLSVTPPVKAPPADTVTKVTFLGPRSGWGFVKATCPYYGPDGKRLGTLPGGTLFKYRDVKASSKNAVLECTVQRGAAWEGPFLIDCTDIAGYEGDPDALDPATVKSLAAYFTLSGKITDRQEALAEEALAANPHFESARQAQQAYQDSIAKAAEMERQMNTLTGSRKSKALEALRAFKYEQVRIKAQADQEAAAYKAWKDAHPADPAQLASDPQLQSLKADLQDAAAKVPGLIPPAS
jgi:hypothetical protein